MNLVERWQKIDAAWKFALGAYIVARAALTAWAFVIALIFPATAQNIDLFGAPVLAVFNLTTSQRYAFSREFEGAILTFRLRDLETVIDEQTASVWSLREGRAIEGKYAGQSFKPSAYSVEEIFPYHGIAPSSNLVWALWQRFDTNWYLKIAQRGYDANDGSIVFFPMYPALIRLVSAFVGDGMLAALIVSNGALIGASAFLYRLVEESFDGASARRTVAYTVLFPTGFFLFAAYTEALFLFFTLGAFVFARQHRWCVAALFGALAALTRLQGSLLIVPLALMWWQQSRITHHASRISVYVLLAIPVATLAFLVSTNLSLLNSYVGELHARFVLPWDNIIASFALVVNGTASFIDISNLVATLGVGAMLISAWRRLPREHVLYALLMFLAPLFRMTETQPLVSMNRYVLVLFPMFMLLGVWGKNAWVNRAIVYLSFPLQMYFVAQFVLWGWVG